jgi:arylsulfatase A-like enzyme
MHSDSTRHRLVAGLEGTLLMLVSVTGSATLWWRTVHAEHPSIGVVILTLDTTRADRLSVYGFMDAVQPNLERLAREGVVFDQATSVAPLTLPAHCSLFTGLYPPAHGVRDNADRPLAPEHTTMAEVLRARGYRTAAFVGSAVLDRERGLAQGFDVYSDVYSGVDDGVEPDPSGESRRQRPANEVMDDAIRWLDGIGSSRFLLWAHLYDPHRPYAPPEPYRSKYADAYIGEIAFADAQIGRLLTALERRHLLDSTIVVVSGDHGESLGDHGERDHGVFVYESVLRVPLIIRGPHLAAGRIPDVVRLVDVMPTVLDLLGMPAPPAQGTSLVDLMRGTRQLDLEAYSESLYPQRFGWSPLRSLREGRYKLIDAPRPELYDLERDPFEQRSIYQERRDVANAMERRLSELADPAFSGSSAGLTVASPEVRQRLAALGYVASGHPPNAAPERRDLPDPKDCIAGLASLEERAALSGPCVAGMNRGVSGARQ